MHIAIGFFSLFNISPFLILLQIPAGAVVHYPFASLDISKGIKHRELLALLSDCCKRRSCFGERKNECPHTSQDSAGENSVRYVKLPQIPALANVRQHTCLRDEDAEWV